jgi:hypothetical protein
MLMAATLVVLVGLWLIASSFKARESQPPEAGSQSNSDEVET